MTKRSESVKRLVRLAMLSALSVVLMLLIRFPVFAAAPYLEYDPADIPVLIAAFMYGPWHGLAVTVVVSIIQGLTVSSGSGPIGVVMHILATGAFCIVGGLIYRKLHNIKGAVAALCCGSVAMTVVMACCNLVFTPIFTGMPVESVAAMLAPIIIPFNLIKAGINSVGTFIIYKPIGRLFAGKASK